jgi:prepilin-type N-terminal cleavage/methylation domain-containing protein
MNQRGLRWQIMEWENKMKRGLTLIEMLVAMTITGIILAITVTQFMLQRHHIDIQERQIKLDRDTRLSLVFIANELRELGLDPVRTHSFGITNGDTTTITYLTDRNTDGIVDPADNGTIAINGDTLLFNNQFIMNNVTRLYFTYFKNDIVDTFLPGELPVNEDDGFGFFTPEVAGIRIRLATEINEKGRIMAQSDQRIEAEMKNR